MQVHKILELTSPTRTTIIIFILKVTKLYKLCCNNSHVVLDVVIIIRRKQLHCSLEALHKTKTNAFNYHFINKTGSKLKLTIK